jgi:hypothetical protein
VDEGLSSLILENFFELKVTSIFSLKASTNWKFVVFKTTVNVIMLIIGVPINVILIHSGTSFPCLGTILKK